MMGMGLAGLGLSQPQVQRGILPPGYAVNGRQPVLLLDFSAGVYADNPAWWAEAGSSPYEVSARLPVVILDFELDRYAGNEVWWAEAPTQPADAVVFCRL